ncbi:hypothetical protein [Massilia psychrophila]|jgi:hypothetical protein|uniref:hypothetical protein n=1 Tax=Massilia psychrophila TaxID=1603353 RepID=UPI0015D4D66D|nr:hypothetical protein [Massilia psychrophila]
MCRPSAGRSKRAHGASRASGCRCGSWRRARASELRFRTLAQAMPDQMRTVTADGKLN